MLKYDLALTRHSASRVVRTLCTELGYGTTLSAPEVGATMEVLCRHVLEDVDSYSRELHDPARAWQMGRMVDHVQVRSPVL